MPDYIMDIFNDDAFSMVELTQAINLVPNNYGRVGQLGLFRPRGITTTVVAVEYKQGVLNLLQTGLRGAPAPVNQGGKRSIKNFTVPHIPLEDTIKAEEIQNVRPFGTSSRLATIMDKVNEKLADMAAKHFITWEWLRVGALKGKVLDADGSTILDLFAEFNVTEKQVDFEFEIAAAGEVAAACREVLRHIEDNLAGEVMDYVHCLCSPEFFDGLVGHNDCREAYNTQQGNVAMRDDLRRGFRFQGILFEEYRGQADDPQGTTRKFIEENTARFFPVGTAETFIEYLAPADFEETVNTVGLALYARQEAGDFNRWRKLHTQSNHLPLCHRPAVLVKGYFTPAG